MEFNKNLEDLSTHFSSRKNDLKRFLIKHFKKDEDYIISKEKLNDIKSGRPKEYILLNDKTFELITNSYNLKNRYTTNINTQNPFLTNIESNTIGFIQTILKDIIECKRQFKIGIYFIDLYIPPKNLAIECDEYNHSNYDNTKEIEREKYIKEKLKCEIIRFDPCSKDFIFEEFVNKILKLTFL
jgi:very-short-patch-repair endonuclease